MWTWKLSSSKHRVTTDPPNLEVFKIDNAQDFFKNLDFIIEKNLEKIFNICKKLK